MAAFETQQMDGREFYKTTAIAKMTLADPAGLPAPVRKTHKALASAAAFADHDNPDLLWVQFAMDSEGGNKNQDYLPRPVLMGAYGTAKFKPMDMEHIITEKASMIGVPRGAVPAMVDNTIFGVMAGSALADSQGTLLTPAQITALDASDDPYREPGDRITVVAWAALYKYLFPQTIDNLVTAIEDGDMSVSMERWNYDWDFIAPGADGDVQVFGREAAASNGVEQRWKARQTLGSSPIYRRSLKCVYGGVASTANPANPLASYLDWDSPAVKLAASESAADEVLAFLLAQHSEVHKAFAVSPDETLVRQHRRIVATIAEYVGDGNQDGQSTGSDASDKLA
jgi:hypothetical protein